MPEMLRSDVIRRGHCSKVACNPGVSSTMFLFKQHFWWPSVTSVRTFIVLCVCVVLCFFSRPVCFSYFHFLRLLLIGYLACQLRLMR